ncbi:hypothetical protein [Enterocloster alcoholdehydrogenati]|uniref:hypothetical protein n=1 Tax=Enterocloster alcoholdehydrogenati TaxID=2547410 RepID=UPI001FAE5C39|nr:hypothetical protein [Enterocloster alcoholdehydrogenati]
MGVYKKAVITEAGEALTARAVSGEATIQFSHTKTSAYTYPNGTNLKKLTDLQEVKQTVIPSNIQLANDTLVSIRSMFDNSGITQEYLIQNVGIYASDGETEVLFAICQATTPDQMPAFNGVAPSSFIYNVQISIAQAEQLSISVNTAGTATVQDVLDLEQKMEEKKLDSFGGDASNTVVSLEDPASSDDKYPEISGKGSLKNTLGKLYRWVNSLKANKVDSIGGDTADTLVSAFDASSDSFPVPAAKEKARTRWGKMKKFTEDFRNWMTGVCLIGQIVNNCVTDRTDLPLSAAQGKVLMDLYTVLNTNSSKIGHAHDERYYTEAEVNNLFNTYQGLPQYSMDLFNIQSGGRLLYYDANTKNTPYKAGITQASEGVAITVGDWGNFITSLAIPKGDSRLYIYSRANSIITDWKML